MGDKRVETLGSKIQFSSILETFPPFPLRTMLIFLFLRLHNHSANTTLNWGAGDIRELTLDVNKIE